MWAVLLLAAAVAVQPPQVKPVDGYTASLVAADGWIYATGEEGQVRVVKAGPNFELLAINKLGEDCLCHPAISNGKLFFRGREHVLAFGVKPTKTASRERERPE
jgi:hypothetical protein